MTDANSFLKEAIASTKRKHREIIARLIVDTEKKEVIFIPKNINHPEFIAAMLKKNKEWLKSNQEKITHFVGCAVEIIDGQISQILIGVSGLEVWLKRVKSPFHDKEEVNSARNILLGYLSNAQIPFSAGYKLNVMYL